jgi:hypothetical protein
VADVKRRVAELAAEMRAPRPQDGGGAGFGELDLDFDDRGGRRTGDSGVRGPAVAGRPLPAATPPPARAGARPLPAAAPTGSSGFGVLDIPLDALPPAAMPAPSTSSPGSGIRTGMGAVGRPAFAPTPAARPAPAAQSARPAASQAPATAAAAPAGGDLGDQRIRQIYAKYVETKRSTQESTAGVTFEKLAASLRAQAEKLKTTHPSKSIDYEVVVKDGKTHLKPVLR